MLTTGSTWTGWQANRPLLTKLNSREWEEFVWRVNLLRRRYSRRVLRLCRQMLTTLNGLPELPSISWS